MHGDCRHATVGPRRRHPEAMAGRFRGGSHWTRLAVQRRALPRAKPGCPRRRYRRVVGAPPGRRDVQTKAVLRRGRGHRLPEPAMAATPPHTTDWPSCSRTSAAGLFVPDIDDSRLDRCGHIGQVGPSGAEARPAAGGRGGLQPGEVKSTSVASASARGNVNASRLPLRRRRSICTPPVPEPKHLPTWSKASPAASSRESRR